MKPPRTIVCVKHGVPFVLTERGRYLVSRCPACVEKARASVTYAREEICKRYGWSRSKREFRVVAVEMGGQ